MSWIDRMFERDLLPISEAMRSEGRSDFPLGPEPERSTYLEERAEPRMTGEAFESCRWEDAAGFEAALLRLWEAAGRDELCHLAPRMAELAQRLRAAGEDDSGDVSDLTYVMF